MIIELKKFGTTLVSRQTGKEALAAFLPTLEGVDENEIVEISFEGVLTFSPSWGDEFLRPLHERFGDRLILHPSSNQSVILTIELLEEINKIKFVVKK
ncbi:MAG: hypothetical protein ACD_56C00036G0016 [uncultured bacterium]|nr:MAG: hypothetical protein ACD_56C00036G0016 [uncultured bacterium]